MACQLSINFTNDKLCFCGSNYGNQTWSVINNGGTFKYCSPDCLEQEYPPKELKFSLMDFYKGKECFYEDDMPEAEKGLGVIE